MEEGLKAKLSNYSPKLLAYYGDAIYELLTREYVINLGEVSVDELNKRAKKYVTAVAQSAAVEKLLPVFTENELALYKRGRNTNGNNSSKSAAALDYRRATGLECLFGYLHLAGEQKRLKELFNIITGAN